MESPTFKFSITVPRRVVFPLEPSQVLDRAEFFEWIWGRFSDKGLVGVHEGTLLSEEAVEEGLETESWTVDSGEAPRERDWVGHLEEGTAELYFASFEEASSAVSILKRIAPIQVGDVEKQEPQDWDAQWKASFTGVNVPPFWRVAPPWETELSSDSKRILKINPGAGFGTGTHETTQLCLRAIGERLVEGGGVFKKSPMLDFGSGSGILAIAMALLGGEVDAVEIDPLAIDNALENASLNQVQERIQFLRSFMHESKTYSVIVANILRPVLLEFAEQLVLRLRPEGVLILSGLIESDVESVVKKYSTLLGSRIQSNEPLVYEIGEWRAIVFGCSE